MKLTSSTLFLFFCLTITVSAQTAEVTSDSSAQVKQSIYFFSIQSGALFGDKVTFTSSTIHGVKIGKRLRLGAGIGFDSFEDAQTMPVFGSASWDLFGKKNVVFFQMNYGWSPYAWGPALKDNYAFKDIKGGETFSAMIGYRIASGNLRIALLAGFKHQDVTINYNYPVYYNYYGLISYNSFSSYPVNSQKVNEAMNRFAISLSVGWR